MTANCWAAWGRFEAVDERVRGPRPEAWLKDVWAGNPNFSHLAGEKVALSLGILDAFYWPLARRAYLPAVIDPDNPAVDRNLRRPLRTIATVTEVPFASHCYMVQVEG